MELVPDSYMKKEIEDFFEEEIDWTLHSKPIDPNARDFAPYVSVDFDDPDNYYLITYFDRSKNARNIFGDAKRRGCVINGTPHLKIKVPRIDCDVRPIRVARFVNLETEIGIASLFGEGAVDAATEQALDLIDEAEAKGEKLDRVKLYLTTAGGSYSDDLSLVILPTTEFVVEES